MDFENFESKILKDFTNKMLNKQEIEQICKKAIDLKIIDSSDIQIEEIPENTTENILKIIRRCRNLYLNTSINDKSFISTKYHSPISRDHTINKDPTIYKDSNLIRDPTIYKDPNLIKDSNFISDNIVNSPFYNQKRDFLNSKFESPLVTKNQNIENPFTNDNDLMSFCEDLRTKTKSIKKNQKGKTIKLINEVIDNFVQYKIRKKKSNKYVYSMIICGVCIITYIIYKPVPI
ncbi:uncharacterized protein VNE69_04141 [Vairimorpha necatrix]|uniref:Uncharacterized protein n=1 Tax=Vairimorpha necatrix TaxID=6039 RepID=A0AAX4JBG1_9MICR